MLELTGLAMGVRTLSYLYWLIAIGALALALWRGKTARRKMIWATIVVVAFGFLPIKALIAQHQRDAFAKEAWAYFKKLCDEKSGEKIYKTFDGVKSVLIVKPLPPATDANNFDQYWFGDPYSASATTERGMYAATRLTIDRKHRSGTGVQKGLDFVEIMNERGEGFIQIHRPESSDKPPITVRVDKPASTFGVSWEDISTSEDRKYWIAGSRLRVFQLEGMDLVAERVGFLIEPGFGATTGGRRPWLTARGIGPNRNSCPDAHDATDQWFITSVFKQQ